MDPALPVPPPSLRYVRWIDAAAGLCLLLGLVSLFLLNDKGGTLLLGLVGFLLLKTAAEALRFRATPAGDPGRRRAAVGLLFFGALLAALLALFAAALLHH